ncbi:hypothetical protein ABPG74_015252 [Tetrahymena malaccensis]
MCCGNESRNTSTKQNTKQTSQNDKISKKNVTRVDHYNNDIFDERNSLTSQDTQKKYPHQGNVSTHAETLISQPEQKVLKIGNQEKVIQQEIQQQNCLQRTGKYQQEQETIQNSYLSSSQNQIHRSTQSYRKTAFNQQNDLNQTYCNDNGVHKSMLQSKLSTISTQDVILNIKIDEKAFDILKNGQKITEINKTPIECLQNLNHDFLIIKFDFNESTFKIYASLQNTPNCRKHFNQLIQKYKKKYLENEKAHIQFKFFNQEEDELIFFIVNISIKNPQTQADH